MDDELQMLRRHHIKNADKLLPQEWHGWGLVRGVCLPSELCVVFALLLIMAGFFP